MRRFEKFKQMVGPNDGKFIFIQGDCNGLAIRRADEPAVCLHGDEQRLGSVPFFRGVDDAGNQNGDTRFIIFCKADGGQSKIRCIKTAAFLARDAEQGQAIGGEGVPDVVGYMLGPGLNILRTPLCGRNFEYLGEDPFLTSRLAVGYIRGEQSQDIASCAKHFAATNQEFERGSINVEVDERALREIYLPAFKAAVQEAGVWSVMGAYNQLRGSLLRK